MKHVVGAFLRQVVGVVAAGTLSLLLLPAGASAQELEPGAYWPIPVGLNIATVVNSVNWGDLAFDPSAPIDEANATINTTAFSFTRALAVAGRSTNLASCCRWSVVTWRACTWANPRRSAGSVWAIRACGSR